MDRVSSLEILGPPMSPSEWVRLSNIRGDGLGDGLYPDSYCGRWGYRGVIIGWDEKARAPEQWLREMHSKEPEWRNQ